MINRSGANAAGVMPAGRACYLRRPKGAAAELGATACGDRQIGTNASTEARRGLPVRRWHGTHGLAHGRSNVSGKVRGREAHVGREQNGYTLQSITWMMIAASAMAAVVAPEVRRGGGDQARRGARRAAARRAGGRAARGGGATGTASRNVKIVGAHKARWALEGQRIGRRRHRRRYRRGWTRGRRLGRPVTWDELWRPWTSDSEIIEDIPKGQDGVEAATMEAIVAAAGGWRGVGGGIVPVSRRGQFQGPRRGVLDKELRPAPLRRNGGTVTKVTAAIVAALMLTCRIGEASNHGPAQGLDYEDGEAPLVEASRKRVVEYPTPHRDGFRDIATPGFDADAAGPGRRKEEEEEFRLLVEAVNSTGWGPLKRRLLSTTAQVVLAQETWVLQGPTAGAARWARKLGWEAI